MNIANNKRLIDTKYFLKLLADLINMTMNRYISSRDLLQIFNESSHLN